MKIDFVVISFLYSVFSIFTVYALMPILPSQKMFDCGKLFTIHCSIFFCPCITVTFPSFVE